jgi:hypothetical protein
VEQPPKFVKLTRKPCVVKAGISFARLLQVHRNGDVVSPRVVGIVKPVATN